MFEIETKELKISDELNRKIEMICRFACVKYEFIPGNIKSIKNTNIAYVKPHILKVKGNDYYTPFIKSKLENNTKDYTNELKELDDRIKTAYIKGVMKLEDFDKEIKHIDYRKLELEKMIKEQKQYESLSFTVDDLIIFEDKQKIDLMTNPSNYLNLMSNWFMLSRKEKQKIISRYIDNLELERNGDILIILN